ncbi:hypothetical protein ACTJJ0_26865 [Chitinophaga sp. 22321]|uniref:Uncharacterized protein n=1 Tax=Chitinophaga hostae TaxID=2831022 RepID=A0ABS5J6C7_9BACT|nr:hypothetical protein [Chitinophaga hostae]MBS0030734.1 hypothetical protein [Chitinophaga hostae]
MTNTPYDHHQEAVKTYMEQTKLLVTLASAFLLAPAFFYEKLEFIGWALATAEVLFILSVLAGYVVFGSIAGSQHKGTPDVYRPATMNSSVAQLIFFLVGIGFLLFAVFNAKKEATAKEEKAPPQVIYSNTYIAGDTCCCRPNCTGKRSHIILKHAKK